MMPRPPMRAPRPRGARATKHQPRLESLAAEFALLTQRRARAIHQLALLDQQRAAAGLNFDRLQARITWLMQRMDALNPELRGLDDVPPPEPEPPPKAPSQAALAAINRRWAAAQPVSRSNRRT
jgi:hypothetical protein